MMADTIYVRLREFLDQFPLGFPKTSSGVEIKILKRLFTEEEAAIAVLLTPFPEETDQIAKRTGHAELDLKEKLESMSKKGLIFRIQRKGKILYNAAPFMIGLYEYSVKKIDKGLAALYKEYYETAYLEEMGASNVPGFKVLPIAEHVQTDLVLLPFLKIKDEIRMASKISVTECICRKEARLTGGGCAHPMETCLSFGVAAEYYIHNGIGREIDAEEAIAILYEADRAGLVHAGSNTKHLSNICNCCPCCCASMKGITHRGYDKHKYLNALFEAIIDENTCIACEDCIDRCPVGAISVENAAMVKREKCLGCGLCAGTCPNEAITLQLREDREEPFDRMVNLGMAIIQGKKKTPIGI
jgi:H+/Na+-translocating ferredoxin:NAD+ oxidoreductase subunit B